jgi:hypothetical protein
VLAASPFDDRGQPWRARVAVGEQNGNPWLRWGIRPVRVVDHVEEHVGVGDQRLARRGREERPGSGTEDDLLDEAARFSLGPAVAHVAGDVVDDL